MISLLLLVVLLTVATNLLSTIGAPAINAVVLIPIPLAIIPSPETNIPPRSYGNSTQPSTAPPPSPLLSPKPPPHDKKC